MKLQVAAFLLATPHRGCSKETRIGPSPDPREERLVLVKCPSTWPVQCPGHPHPSCLHLLIPNTFEHSILYS